MYHTKNQRKNDEQKHFDSFFFLYDVYFLNDYPSQSNRDFLFIRMPYERKHYSTFRNHTSHHHLKAIQRYDHLQKEGAQSVSSEFPKGLTSPEQQRRQHVFFFLSSLFHQRFFLLPCWSNNLRPSSYGLLLHIVLRKSCENSF